MKKILSILILTIAFCYSNLLLAQTINVDGVERSYLIHIPDNLPEGEDVPVVIALHYLGCSAASFESITSFSLKADQEGFIAVYPQGVGNSWNAGSCCDPAASEGVDDIGFITALIDTLIEENPIDPEKVFLAGFSNGAIMGYALANVLSERIAGYAAVAGLLAMEVDPPAHPVPILHIHALDDSAVDIDGMWGYPSVYDLLDNWKTINGITAEPDTFRNDSKIKGILYPSEDSTANVMLYLSETGGHQWNVNSRLGTTNRMWEFFSSGINKTYAIYDTISEGPRQRDFKIQIPSRFFSSVDSTEKYPLILAAHGWNSNALEMEQMTGFSVKANAKHFFVAYLHYVGPPPDLSWNYFMNAEKPDDIGYSKAVIDTMFARFPIDSTKVFVVGFSDGCGLANRLAFETNGLINATGTVAGMVNFDAEVETNPVRMIHLHAKNDPAVNYSNVRNTALDYWLTVNDCNNAPDTVYNEQNYVGEVWTNSESDTTILFYTLPWNEHAWPVNNGTTMKVSATDLIWDFFNTGIAFPTIQPIEGLSDYRVEPDLLKVFPNPAREEITIDIDVKQTDNLILQIFQTNGKIIRSVDLGSTGFGLNRYQFDVSDLSEGYYLLRVKGNTTLQCSAFLLN